ncbi:hypothetical protein CBP51_00510 [Cellvibrio mixtus]|uniref:Uncharacterized protein n=1 Tax=Cellvibrio mixtus TaxID=39650 RepID=A0A266Q6W4_9GAMM|nr:hypothetical protein [Cellvibrio mixtus]OZY85570.1 hypothetical protein CBP51_00510 [Cellvibrio mixtus]
MKNFIFLVIFSVFSVPAFSWVEGAGVTIEEVIMWEGADTGITHFKLSNGKWCYVPGTQKNLNSLILAVHIAGKKINVHCHDTADQNGSGSVAAAHRLHRIVVLKN